MKIYPLVNYVDAKTTHLQAALAQRTGACGVFLVSANGHDNEAMGVAVEMKLIYPELKVGLKLPNKTPIDTLRFAVNARLDMVWLDDVGVGPAGLTAQAQELSWLLSEMQEPYKSRLRIFVSLACEYPWNALDPLAGEAAKFGSTSASVHERAESFDRSLVPGSKTPLDIARQLIDSRFIPLINWADYGDSDDAKSGFKRVTDLMRITDGRLAVASGTGPANVFAKPAYITHLIDITEARPTASHALLHQVNTLVARVNGFDPMLML
jgi:hypothetical protein